LSKVPLRKIPKNFITENKTRHKQILKYIPIPMESGVRMKSQILKKVVKVAFGKNPTSSI
jgi:hypothetical protein